MKLGKVNGAGKFGGIIVQNIVASGTDSRWVFAICRIIILKEPLPNFFEELCATWLNDSTALSALIKAKKAN